MGYCLSNDDIIYTLTFGTIIAKLNYCTKGGVNGFFGL